MDGNHRICRIVATNHGPSHDHIFGKLALNDPIVGQILYGDDWHTSTIMAVEELPDDGPTAPLVRPKAHWSVIGEND